MTKKIFISIAAFALFFFSTAQAANAQVFKFDCPTAQIPVGQTFQMKVLINTAGQEVNNGDAVIIFDPAKVSIDDAQSGNFLDYFSKYANLGGAPNKYLISSYEQSPYNGKAASTDTLFATLSMTAKAAGSAPLSYECTPGTGADSNINSVTNSDDIIKCGELKSCTLALGGTSTSPSPTGPTAIPSTGPTSSVVPTAIPTAVPTITRPTSPPVPTATPRPTAAQLQRAGSGEVTIGFIGIGMLLTVAGVLFIF